MSRATAGSRWSTRLHVVGVVLLLTVAAAVAVVLVLFATYRSFMLGSSLLMRGDDPGLLLSGIGFTFAIACAVVALVAVSVVWTPFEVAIARAVGDHVRGDGATLTTACSVVADRPEVVVRWAVCAALSTGMTAKAFPAVATAVRSRLQAQTEQDWDRTVRYASIGIALAEPQDLPAALAAVERQFGRPPVLRSAFVVGLYLLPVIALVLWTVSLAATHVVDAEQQLLSLAFLSMPTVFVAGGAALSVVDTVRKTIRYVDVADVGGAEGRSVSGPR